MGTVNKLVSWVSAGALIGLFLASLIAPSVLGWYNTPGAGQALCPCADITRETASRLLWTQATGALVGGILFLGLGIFFEMRRRKKLAAAPAAHSTTTTTTTT
jgi:hypothetical protein